MICCRSQISLPSSREYNRCKVFLYIGYSELKIPGFLRWAVGKSGRFMWKSSRQTALKFTYSVFFTRSTQNFFYRQCNMCIVHCTMCNVHKFANIFARQTHSYTSVENSYFSTDFERFFSLAWVNCNDPFLQAT
jgi:hypothetical protein